MSSTLNGDFLQFIIPYYICSSCESEVPVPVTLSILSSLDMLMPNEICTETYLVVDAFDTELEAKALQSYLKTCFVRFLISLLASTQHLSKEKFAYVPLQDFTSNSDIDWSQSIADIDRQLYAKYGLSDDEIAFIEKMIKPME